jgi:hypothetical protein
MDVLVLDRGHDVGDRVDPEGFRLDLVAYAQPDQSTCEGVVRAYLVPINTRVWFGFEDAS